MARPLKDGVAYFPKDTDFYQDDKVRMLRAEFGEKGMYTLDYILCEIYGKNGYFLNWDSSKCLLIADGAGCSCTPDYISEFILGCLRCSFFDGRVFNAFGILTSAGIQRRYIRMFNSRDEISIIKEYWLLDIESKNDVPPGILNKLAFKSIKTTENPDKSTENPDKSTGNAQNKIKQNKEKINERKEGAAAASPSRHQYGQYSNVLLSDEELETLKAEFPVDWSNRIERLSEYIASTGKTYKSHLATLRSWARRDKEKKQEKRRGMMESSLDLSEYDKWEQSPERYAALSAQLGKGE